MMAPRRVRWITLALVLAAAATATATAGEAKVERREDLVYARVGDRELKLDLARPGEGEGPFPAVVVIHGGAWRAGNKRDNRRVLDELAGRGYVAVSPEYRFCPKETFPAQVLDVKAAVRWIKVHAKEHKIDPERVGAMGFSAGGHLALMLGVTGAGDGLEGEAPADAPDTKVRAVVNFFGPSDLLATDIPEVSRPLLKDFLGGTAEEKPEAAREASPISYVTKGDAPVLTFQGTRDPLVPHSQALRLADAMTAAGVPGRVELLVGAGHGWGGADLERTAREAIDFLDTYLKPKVP
ncbi:MAG TPA: alpha/beta hydrolase [Isosphaeraceae bacterium]|jgi:acetyl esterase/lipase|nr:alpha/beta hydrolase [Isosphaeraceae bacterium]